MEFVHESKKMKMCVLKSTLWAFLLCFPSCSVSEDPQRQRITARPGKTVTLPCRATNNVNISVVQWIRSDLKRHILMKSDGHLNTTDQDPSYKNRVQLKDDEMKNGDLSLVLKKVKSKDKGTYKCQYKEEGGEHMKTADQIKLIVYLDVRDQLIAAHPGDDVILSCRAPDNVTIATVKWTRSDLKKHVYLKSDGHLQTADQDPSYKNRVQLKDDEMKNGDLSLVLKKVTSTDGGTYVCRYKDEGGGRRMKRDAQSKPTTIVYLTVEGWAHGRLGVILPVILVAVVALVVGFVIYKKRRGRSGNNPDQPGDDPDVQQQLQQNETDQENICPNISDIQCKNSTETESTKVKLQKK